MSILITGGAGYIGSITSYKIIKNYNEKILVVDKKSSINIEKIRSKYDKNLIFYSLDITDYQNLEEIFKKHKIRYVIHFAAYTIVSESEQKPFEYLNNNINSTINLLDLMEKYGVENLIFSSSASVYGKALYTPIDEEHPKNPASFYALSKKICEDIIESYKRKGINYISLRYFNPAGSVGDLGEEHNPETHLIPILIRSLIEGKVFKIYGNNYSTPDGTCIRDFIHIEDLVEAHMLSLEKIEKIKNDVFNVGINKGYSVLEVVKKSIDLFKDKMNPNFSYTFYPPREGDVDILVAKCNKIQNIGFKAKFNLEDILYSVWNYEYSKIYK